MIHILRSQQFDRPLLETLFSRADDFRKAKGNIPITDRLKGGIFYGLYYGPSTRTRISFDTAAAKLGLIPITTDNAGVFSSAAKGETLEDTIRVCCGYSPRAIVLRYHEEGGAERAAAVSSVPIINAGDGPGQHPTQALIDLFTILTERGSLDDMLITIGGDPAYGRAVRSLAYLLAKFNNVRVRFVSPETLRVSADIRDYLNRHNVPFEELNDASDAVRDADVVYWTRIQKEWLPKDSAAAVDMREQYRVTPALMNEMKPKAILMHPLPRVDEISHTVDADPRAKFFLQAEYGLYLRMALLEWVTEK